MAGQNKLLAGTLTLVSAGGGTSTLANNARLNVGTLDNTSLLAPWADFELNTGFSVAPTPGTGIVVACYLVPYVDGTNATDVDTSTPRFPSGAFAGNFEVVKSQTGTQRLTLQSVPLSALKYDVYVDNQAGQTMAAAWTLKAAPSLWQYT